MMTLMTLVLTVCGDGRIDTVDVQQCAPCVPGQRCPCGVTPVPTEACDGKSLGGKSCVGLGFLGGSLSCTATCQVDTSGCTRTQAPGREVSPAVFGALAVSSDRIAVVTSSRSALTFESFSLPGLTPAVRSPLPLAVKADGAGGVGELRVAQAGSGWVVAGQVYGSTSELQLWQVSPEGVWSPRGTAQGQRPLFLINDGQALSLGGETWAGDSRSVGLTVTVLTLDGKPTSSRFLAAPDRLFTGNSASAAFFGGAVHVLSTCTPNQANSPVRVDGQPLDQLGGSGALAADGTAGAQVLVANDGLWRLRLDAKGRPVAAPGKLLSSGAGIVVSASVASGRVQAWLKRGAVLTRLTEGADGAVKLEDLVSGVNFEVLAVVQTSRGALTLTSADGHTTLHRF